MWGLIISVGGCVGIMGGLLFWKWWSRRRALACWNAVANSIPGLQMRGPDLLAIDGTIDGLTIGVGLRVRGTGENRTSYTHIVCRVPTRLPEGFALARENVARKVFAALGGQDHEVGDPEFDRRVTVRAHAADEARWVLGNPEVRHAIADILQSTSGLQVMPGGKVNFEARGLMRNPEKLSAAIRNTARMASLLDQSVRR